MLRLVSMITFFSLFFYLQSLWAESTQIKCTFSKADLEIVINDYEGISSEIGKNQKTLDVVVTDLKKNTSLAGKTSEISAGQPLSQAQYHNGLNFKYTIENSQKVLTIYTCNPNSSDSFPSSMGDLEKQGASGICVAENLLKITGWVCPKSLVFL